MSVRDQTILQPAPRPLADARCPACGLAQITAGPEVPDHEYAVSYLARYAQCQICETLFQQPMPSMAQLAGFYPPDYHSVTHRGLLTKLRNGIRISRLTELAPPDSIILDYGCGDGSFLLQAAQRMRHQQYWGFEIAERPETSVLANGAVTLVRGQLDDLMAVLPRCGLITMNHVIEHLPDPAATVSALASRLIPGGVIEGQTPAADSLEHQVFGRRWSGYHAPRHTVVFSTLGLWHLLQRCGLSQADVKGAFNPAGMAVSFGTLFHDNSGGRIPRTGLKWLFLLTLGAAFGPIDLLSGRPGIVNFVAYKHANELNSEAH